MVAVLAAGLTMPAAAQQTFEGSVMGTMTLPKGKTAPFRYYQLGSRVRQEFSFDEHTMASIYDGTTGDMIMLIPQQKKYMVMNSRSASSTARQLAQGMTGRGAEGGAPDFSKMKVTPTGQHETIAGIGCDHYLFENTEDTGREHKPIDICGATGLGFMGMAGQQNSMMPSTIALLRSQNPELARLARQGFFPLKMTFSGKDGNVVWQATQVDRRRPDAAMFQPPAGYTEMVIPSMPGLPGRKP
jgi:hypothetical protein